MNLFPVLVEKLLLEVLQFALRGAKLTFPYYDEQWYEDLDLLITSDYDYGRYVKDPGRFHEILPFYESVRLNWNLVYQITPAESLTGPTFWLYKYPHLPTTEAFDTAKITAVFHNSDSSEAVNFMGKLALVLSIKGKLLKSEQLLREVIDVDPTNREAARQLVTIENNLGKLEDALKWAETYLRLNPMDPEILNTKGRILIILNRLGEAEKALKEALNLDEHREEPYRGLMVIYGVWNDRQKLVDILTRYAGILPANSDKWRLVNSELKKLRGPQ